MGIRIHKCLGYGINIDANNIDWEGAFERLDENSEDGELDKLMLDEYARLKGIQHRDALHFAIWGPMVRDERGLMFRVKDYPSRFLEVIHHASNADDMGGWLVFQPPGCKDWCRFDDDIDYAEYHILNTEEPDYATSVSLLPHPIYPFIGYQDVNTGERIKIESNLARSKTPNAVPFVPACVRAIAEHTKVCDWRKLRPVVATWWG